MKEGGRIILNSTTLLRVSVITPNYLLYNATKGAIEQMTRVLSKDLGRRKITVNCIAPGATGTDLFLKGKSQSVIDQLSSTVPFGRLGEPEEIADVLGFLSSDAARWINGQVIQVNGGQAPVA